MHDTRPVIVGVDGSPSSLDAVQHAADLAAHHGTALHLIQAYQHPSDRQPGGAFAYYAADAARVEMAHNLRSLVERTRAARPDLVRVEGKQINGPAATVLVERSRSAALTVVGSRGHGGFGEMLLGSVSTQVAAHAYGPVVVVRSPAYVPGTVRHDGAVVAGYDGSPGARLALRFAADEAAVRGLTLLIARLYAPYVPGEADLAERTVQEATSSLAETYPDLKIEPLALPAENTGYGLIDLSRDAALTVVGSRGHGGFFGLLLGSTGTTLIHHGYGEIAVVHPVYAEVPR